MPIISLKNENWPVIFESTKPPQIMPKKQTIKILSDLLITTSFFKIFIPTSSYAHINNLSTILRHSVVLTKDGFGMASYLWYNINMRLEIKEDVFIVATIVLVALIAFGIGRLSVPKSEPIQIMNLEKASVEDLKAPEKGINKEQTYQGDYTGKVVGSVNSETYWTITENL